MQKVCSSPTTEGLAGLINRFYYSTNWQVRENNGNFEAYNDKLQKSAGKIEFKKNRYTFYI